MNKTCFICGSDKSTLKGSIGTYSLMECFQCGLQFLDPIPDEKTLDKIYSDYYSIWDIKQYENEIADMKMKTFRGYLSKITNFVSSGKLLDIGCATGELMRVAKEIGFDVYGVEISPDGIQRCKDIFGENKIIGSSLKKGDFPAGFFDVITISDVLEHIPDTKTFLDNIYNILKPNGILMIITPDTSSWFRKIMGIYWPDYKEEHIYYYNSSNIYKLLSSHFYILTINSAYKTLTLNYCASVLEAWTKSNCIKKIALLLKSFPTWIKMYYFKINIGEMLVLCKKYDN